MKSGFKTLAATIATIATIAMCATMEAHAAAPEIDIDYSPLLDAACALVKGGDIKDEWKEELSRKKPELEALWNAVGPTLISSAEKITGHKFPEGRQTVRLTLCDMPSQSIAGISVNMRYALRSFTANPVPLRYKADTLFHELLHKFLAPHSSENSPLLKAHASEPDRTRGHLHLLALQKAVLLSVNAPTEYADVVRIDSKLPGGYYKRAWEIVNATETEYLKYIDEIRLK